MSPERERAGPPVGYPVLSTAFERHLEWARDFAISGDVESALDAIRDAHATFAEVHASGASRGGSAEPDVTMSPVIDHDVLSELRAIAERGTAAADSGGPEAELLEAYESLRARAAALAQAQGWASSEELAVQFPRWHALREIERLDLAVGEQSVTGLAPGRGICARLSEALAELAAWATGVRLAYETLDDERGGRA
jgi:hypothetical protein